MPRQMDSALQSRGLNARDVRAHSIEIFHVDVGRGGAGPLAMVRNLDPAVAKMTEIASINLARITPRGEAKIIAQPDAVALVTDPRQWAYSAEAEIDIPGVESESSIVKIRVEVESGVLGVGLLREDESAWVARASATEGPIARELRLSVPAQTRSGKLVFDNWTEGGKPARGLIRSIKIARDEREQYFRAALAEEELGNRDAAISNYKSLLALDPSHVGAIAGLGRLRFIPPDQPFLEEVRKRTSVDVCAVVIQVRNPCNYRCFYCVAKGHNNEPVERFDLERIDKAYSQIRSTVIGTQFDCGGGEPTVHPQFPELVRICSSHGAVDIPSNNSQDPKRWLPRETARRIFIRSAVHPETEPKLDRYLRYARYLIDAGCQFQALYIAHPTRVAKILEYRDLFSKQGVPFQPISFIGSYEGRLYPHSHTEEEKRLIGLEEETRYWYHRIEPHTGRIRNFRGIPCIAGYRYIYITKDGEFRRCLWDPERVLEGPLDKPEPCGVKKCGCGMWLDKLNAVETVYTHNFYGVMVGAEPIPTDWMEPLAHSLGYGGSETAMTVESIRMYDSLMAAYGKDEFPEEP
jgi:MoaA/NifB/PqqE/SkfB family radical SAM enzyme